MFELKPKEREGAPWNVPEKGEVGARAQRQEAWEGLLGHQEVAVCQGKSGLYPRPRPLFRWPPREPVIAQGLSFPTCQVEGSPLPLRAASGSHPEWAPGWRAGGEAPRLQLRCTQTSGDPSSSPARTSGLNSRHRRRKQNVLTADPLIQPGLGIWQRQPSLIKGIPRHTRCLCIWFCIYTLGTSEEAAGECLHRPGAGGWSDSAWNPSSATCL